jgi:hypothetical protein
VEAYALDPRPAGHDVSQTSATPQAESVSDCSRAPMDATCHRRRPRLIWCVYGFAPPYCDGYGGGPPLPAMRERFARWRGLRRVTADVSDKRALLHTRYFNPPPHVTLVSARLRLPQHCVFQRASIASAAHDQYAASLKCRSTRRLRREILPLARFFREVIEKDLRHEPLQNLWMVDTARVAVQHPGPCPGP